MENGWIAYHTIKGTSNNQVSPTSTEVQSAVLNNTPASTVNDSVQVNVMGQESE